MNILELELYAQDKGFNSVRFKFTDKSGREQIGVWLDAYMGMFRIETASDKGFLTTKQWLYFFDVDEFDFEPIENATNPNQ